MNDKNNTDNSSDSPPLHPRQIMQHLCRRIESNDPNLRVVSLRDRLKELSSRDKDRFYALASLGQALANNTHIIELDLTNSMPMYSHRSEKCSCSCYCQEHGDNNGHVNNTSNNKTYKKHPFSVSSFLSWIHETTTTTANGTIIRKNANTSFRRKCCSRCCSCSCCRCLLAKFYQNAIQNGISIRKLNLSENMILLDNLRGTRCLRSNALINHPSIQELILHKCWLCDVHIGNLLILPTSSTSSSPSTITAATSLPHKLPKLALHLQVLDLSNNLLTFDSATCVKLIMQLHKSTLTHLNCKRLCMHGGCNTMLSITTSDESGTSITSGCENFTVDGTNVDGRPSYALQTLNLFRTGIGSDDNNNNNNDSSSSSDDDSDKMCGNLFHLCQVLYSSNHIIKLRNLNLGHNELGDDGICELSNGLAHNTSLRSLNLSRNDIGNVGAIALANSLENHPLLHTLFLENNIIGDDGAISLITKSNYFYYCNERSSSSSGICHRQNQHNLQSSSINCCYCCCNSRSIHLQHNLVSSSGANRILKVLRKMYNSRIIKFELHMNKTVQPNQHRQIKLYTKLNRLGRRFLMLPSNVGEQHQRQRHRNDNCHENDMNHKFNKDGEDGCIDGCGAENDDHGFPLALWPNLLAKLVSNNDVASLHYFLCHKPDLFQS